MIRVNGIARGRIPVADRGLHYGDGVFETIAVRNGAPEFWALHSRRLEAGCRRLGIPGPEARVLEREARGMCAGRERAVLKIIVTRGEGGRGYGPPPTASPTRILSLHPWPDHPPSHRSEGIEVRLCTTRLGLNPSLAGIKHLNRLEQVLARAEWRDPKVAEGIMLDTERRVIEGTMTNLFLAKDGGLNTPDLSACGVAGIMREIVLGIAGEIGIPSRVRAVGLAELADADEAFLTNSLIDIWPIRRFAERRFAPGRITQALMQALAGIER